MAYIGKTPITGNFVKLDAISVVNGQAAYTMNNGGSAFTDYENVNQFLVSLNGILQAPTDSFTVSGSTLTFASNLSTGDVIDFIIVLGNTLDIGTPSDATVTNAKTNFVSTSSAAGLQIKGDGTTDGTLQLNCSQNSHGIKLKSPSHGSAQSYTITFPTTSPSADKFLKTDGSGNLSFASVSGGLTEADQWRLSSDQSGNADPISSNWERNDSTGFAYIGSGMSQSSGIFTFPSTGIYLVRFICSWYTDASGGNDNDLSGLIYVTTNNSSYSSVAEGTERADGNYASSSCETVVDVTDTSNVKVKFVCTNMNTGAYLKGTTSRNRTHVTFIKLADT